MRINRVNKTLPPDPMMWQYFTALNFSQVNYIYTFIFDKCMCIFFFFLN